MTQPTEDSLISTLIGYNFTYRALLSTVILDWAFSIILRSALIDENPMKIRCTVENSDDLSNNARQFNLAICN